MHYELMKLKTDMDMSRYSLKDLALYFEKFDGYVCKIITDKGIIKFEFKAANLPHLIGMQYAFENRRDSKKYRGQSGFELLKNGEVTYDEIKRNVKNNNKKRVAWRNIDERIKLLPMFLNSITTKTELRTNLGINTRGDYYTHLKGNYFLYRKLHNKSTPMFSLKMINRNAVVLETFVVDNDDSIIKGLDKINIKSIELIAPLENTQPIIEKDNEDIENKEKQKA